MDDTAYWSTVAQLDGTLLAILGGAALLFLRPAVGLAARLGALVSISQLGLLAIYSLSQLAEPSPIQPIVAALTCGLGLIWCFNYFFVTWVRPAPDVSRLQRGLATEAPLIAIGYVLLFVFTLTGGWGQQLIPILLTASGAMDTLVYLERGRPARYRGNDTK